MNERGVYMRETVQSVGATSGANKVRDSNGDLPRRMAGVVTHERLEFVAAQDWCGWCGEDTDGDFCDFACARAYWADMRATG